MDTDPANLREGAKLIDLSWKDIRASWNNGEPYGDFYERIHPRIKSPDLLRPVATPADKLAIELQLKKAEPQELLRAVGMVDTVPYEYDDRIIYPDKNDKGKREFAVWKEGAKKLRVNGYNEPPMDSENDVMTRLYVALDPRMGADAFFALVRELKSQGVLGEMRLCLNLEPMGEGAVGNNSIVMYIYKSQARYELMDGILAAYKAAKRGNNYFFIPLEQRDALLGHNLATFRCLVDTNLTFVEMAQDEYLSYSWDVGGSSSIDTNYLNLPLNGRSHIARINALKAMPARRVWTEETSKLHEKLIDHPESIPDGIVVERVSKRTLRMPALVNYQTERMVKMGNRLEATV